MASEEQTTTGAEPGISFVLPLFNEKDGLEELHGKIGQAMQARPESYEIVFVDDGSTDGSSQVLEAIHERDDKVRVVQLRRNFGKSAAYTAGFEHARGEIVVTMDADLQDDPADIPGFLDKLAEGYDLVSGWKHKGKGRGKARASRLFNRIVARTTGIRLHDFNCPFKAYRREVLGEIDIRGELHRYIPVLAAARGFSVTEIKIENHPRRHGKSKYGRERYLRGMLDLLTVLFITRFSRRPLHLIGLGGILGVLLGFGILLFFTVMHLLYVLEVVADPSWNIHDRPAISLGILLMIVGTQFFSMGLLAELFVSRAGGGRPHYSVKRIIEK
jgi:glycosyltransferase involved in cell wall biosynthesis